MDIRLPVKQLTILQNFIYEASEVFIRFNSIREFLRNTITVVSDKKPIKRFILCDIYKIDQDIYHFR